MASNSIASRRLLHHSVKLYAVSDTDFQAAKDRVGTLTQDPGNDVKLKMYGLFKQVNLWILNGFYASTTSKKCTQRST